MNVTRNTLATLGLAFLCSCGSAPQVIDIYSEPPGARVVVDGYDVGTTPMEYVVPRDKRRARNLVFSAMKSGYREDRRMVKKQGGTWSGKISLVLQPIQASHSSNTTVVVPGSSAPAPNITNVIGDKHVRGDTTTAPPVINNAQTNQGNSTSNNNNSGKR